VTLVDEKEHADLVAFKARADREAAIAPHLGLVKPELQAIVKKALLPDVNPDGSNAVGVVRNFLFANPTFAAEEAAKPAGDKQAREPLHGQAGGANAPARAPEDLPQVLTDLLRRSDPGFRKG